MKGIVHRWNNMKNIPKINCPQCKKEMEIKDNRRYGIVLLMLNFLWLIVFTFVWPNIAVNFIFLLIFTSLGIWLFWKKPRHFHWCGECQVKIDSE